MSIVTIQVVHSVDPELMRMFRSLVNAALDIDKEIGMAQATLDDIVQEVTDLKTVDDSVVSLLTSLNEKLAAAIASGDMTKVQAVSDAITAEKTRLAAAVTANTPTA